MANSLNIDLNKKYVVLSVDAYKGNLIERVFYCEDGFGTSPDTSGRKIYGRFVSDGEECWVSGYEVAALATEEEVEEAEKIYKEANKNGRCK